MMNILKLSMIFMVILVMPSSPKSGAVDGNSISDVTSICVSSLTVPSILSGFVTRLFRISKDKNPPFDPQPVNILAFDRIRPELIAGSISQENQYISLIHPEDDHFVYGKIISVKRRYNPRVLVEILGGELVTVTDNDLYSIGVSGQSREAFIKFEAEGVVPRTPRFTLGQNILVPHNAGGFSSGVIEAFMGDEARVIFWESLAAEALQNMPEDSKQTDRHRRLPDITFDFGSIANVPVELLRRPFQPGDLVFARSSRDVNVLISMRILTVNDGWVKLIGELNDGQTFEADVYLEDLVDLRPLHPYRLFPN